MQAQSVTDLLEESQFYEKSGNTGAAIASTQLGLMLAQSDGDPSLVVNALARLAELHYRLGHFDEMKRIGEQAVAWAGTEPRLRASALKILGNHAMEVGSLQETELYYQEAADLCRQTGDNRALVGILHNLGACVYALRGQFDLAITAEEEALRLACISYPQTKLFILPSLCFDCLLIGQNERAEELLEQYQQSFGDNHLHRGHYLWLCAVLAQLQGDLPAAFNLFAEVRPIAETSGDLGLNIFLRMSLSAWHQMAGNAPAAYDWANDALSWASRTGSRRFIGRALIERGRSAWLKEDFAGAERDLRAAIDELRARQQAYDLTRAQLILAALLHHQRHPEAESVYREAVNAMVSGGFTYLLERERSFAFPLVAFYLSHSGVVMRAINNRLLAQLAGAPPPPLRIITFGHFQVFCRGVIVPTGAWRRGAGELFRLLLIQQNRSLQRDQVIDALWPGKPLGEAVAFFHQATSGLRRALEPDLPDKFPSRYLLVEEGQVRLCLPPGSQVDFEVFETLIGKQDWKGALQVSRGEPFAGDVYHDWAQWKRERLRVLGQKALLAAAGQSLEAGDASQALEYCQLVLVDEPWQEQATLLGMRACMQLKDRPGALRLYASLAQCLLEEFSLQPMQPIQELHRDIMESH